MKLPSRVLICGGRDFNNEYLFQHVLNDFWHIDMGFTPFTIIHGGARGADNLAARWAYDNKMKVESYPADWNTHGKAAGPIRNQQMLDTGIDVVIAFPGGRGTQHMINIAKKAGVEVRVING
jgi:hypothetical protein